MQQDLASNIRSRVSKRFSHVETIDDPALPVFLLALEGFLSNDPWCSPVLKNLLPDGTEAYIEPFFRATAPSSPPTQIADNALARFAWGALRYVASVVRAFTATKPDEVQAHLLNTTAPLKFNLTPSNFSIFKQVYLKSLEFYLLDSLSDQNAVLMQLERYCQRVKFFPSHQEALKKSIEDGEQLEWKLTQDAFEFLFDQGIRVWQQVALPPSERPDFILHLAGHDAIFPLEAKVFTGKKSLQDIHQGFRQICRYISTAKSLRPVSDGCLLVYNVSMDHRLSFKTNREGIFPMMREKTSTPIHLVVVEATRLPAASKDERELIEISEETLAAL